MDFNPKEFIRTNTSVANPSAVPEVKLYLAAEMTPLWYATEESLSQTGLPPPFWAFAWPGGQGVARYIFDNPAVVRGKRVLDFAAGSGVAAIAAMKAGAAGAVAVDIDPMAVAAMEMNAELNGVEVDIFDAVDLTKPNTETDVIFAGDICYQQSMSATLVRWLRLCVEEGSAVFISDPGRAYVPHDGMEQVAQYVVPTSRDLEDSDSRTVTVWRMLKAAEWTPEED